MQDSIVPGKDLIYYSGPFWDEREESAAINALKSGGRWVSAGKHVNRFEREFSKKFKHGSSLMVNSGSSANLVMLAALKKYYEWEDDSEVIVSVVGFPTTIAPIVQNRLKPVFVDIELETLNFNLALIEEKIRSKTRAIFISPVLGSPPDMEALYLISKVYNLVLILDGCDSLGSKYLGQDLSFFTKATSCSFFPSHHMSTGEGGMVSSQDEGLVKLARKFAWWGRDCYCVGAANSLKDGTCGKRFDNHLGLDVGLLDHKYIFSEIGYNLKPLDLQGAIGLVQLEKTDQMHIDRRRIKKRLGGAINALKAKFRVLDELPHAETSWFGVPILCDDQETKTRLVRYLEGERIQTRNYFAGNILLHPGYRHLGDPNAFPLALEVLKRVFFIGCWPGYTEDVVSYIETTFEMFES